ncbi:hypothetical protein PG995_000327 [Apiospora arundinis]
MHNFFILAILLTAQLGVLAVPVVLDDDNNNTNDNNGEAMIFDRDEAAAAAAPPQKVGGSDADNHNLPVEAAVENFDSADVGGLHQGPGC